MKPDYSPEQVQTDRKGLTAGRLAHSTPALARLRCACRAGLNELRAGANGVGPPFPVRCRTIKVHRDHPEQRCRGREAQTSEVNRSTLSSLLHTRWPDDASRQVGQGSRSCEILVVRPVSLLLPTRVTLRGSRFSIGPALLTALTRWRVCTLTLKDHHFVPTAFRRWCEVEKYHSIPKGQFPI